MGTRHMPPAGGVTPVCDLPAPQSKPVAQASRLVTQESVVGGIRAWGENPAAEPAQLRLYSCFIGFVRGRSDLRITEITIAMHERSSPRLAVFGTRDGKLPMGVLRIVTDEGIEGTNFLSYPGPGPLAIANEIVTFVKPRLLGADPLEIGRHWRRLSALSHFINPITVGVVDVALWDIAGQVAGLPVHRL